MNADRRESEIQSIGVRPSILRSVAGRNSRNRFNGNNIVGSPSRNPKGCQKVAGGRSVAKTTGSSWGCGRTPEGCQNFRCRDLLRCDLYRDLRNAAGVEFDENHLCCGLAPLRGAVITNDFSGGLRGLRPPATFLQPFGLHWKPITRVRPDPDVSLPPYLVVSL